LRKVRQDFNKKWVNARIVESDVGAKSELTAAGFEPATKGWGKTWGCLPFHAHVY
jgi:hypothetical protein